MLPSSPGDVKKCYLIVVILLIASCAFAQYTPVSVPNTKLVTNSYVSNPDMILSQSAVSEIDSILSTLESSATAQVAVVMLKSIGDASEVDFAQELFQLWGIGQKSNNNGLLILYVEDQRVIRFHTGFGLEGVLPDVVCKKIQRNSMVPEFREGNIDGGIINGVREVEKILTDPNYALEINAGDDSVSEPADYNFLLTFSLIFMVPTFLIVWATKKGRFANSKSPKHTLFPQMRMKRSTWMILFGLVPVLIIGASWFDKENPAGDAFIAIYLYLMATVLIRLWRERKMIKDFVAKRKFFEVTEYFRKSQGYWWFIALVFPLPFITFLPFHYVRTSRSRNTSRKCTLCDGDMAKLSEKDDDQYLTHSQQVEEKIESVDYDVWKCKSCEATESWHFAPRWSKYTECPSCKAKAYFLASSKTLVSATYSNSGKGESIHQCKACNKSKRSTYSIAQLTRSSSSSSGSSYSSSSSSGGSWGGGSSGGGGASSRW